MTENKQRIVLVTGANGYIGSAVCRAFVRAGWNTYGLIRNPQTREEVALSEIIPVVNTFDTIVSCTEKTPGYAAHFEEVMNCVKRLAEKSNENGVRPLVLWSSGCKDYGMTGRSSREKRDPDSIMHATHVDDCGEAYLSLAELDDRRAVDGQFFNVSGYRYETLEEVAGAVTKEYSFAKGVQFILASEAESHHFRQDCISFSASVNG
ncbi:hypothetical protein FAGAP_2992 [Fusarium agapanthi]|uniref:NAD-dependent epimerase/dehydratase domain-containing protein n=1 Tax=Fusarium agapanthi TaxID=1803897 RepID=A0A9P5BGE9_9HYPO|nr:hypothetical protein FAGAP_2992 [Fusarium agapanthi]